MKQKHIFKSFILLSFLISFFLVVQSCSTEKDVWINRGFHNMNAKYNGYFNAGEIINQTLDAYREKTKEDYTKILPVEALPSKQEAIAFATPMEDAIERCSKVIYKHAMPNPNIAKHKDEEYGKWIDNNWFVIGKAYFLKGEYPEAIEKFKYIIKFYKGEDGIYLARVWLAKAYMAQGDYSKAKIELDKAKREKEESEAKEKKLTDYLKKDKNKSKKKKKKLSKRKRKRMRQEKRKNKKNEPAKYTRKLKLEYEKTFAQYYIETEDYKNAVTHLENAIDLTKKRREKARYRFILAQVYQQMGNGSQAVHYFQKVAKSNAPYEMRFYAKINKALSYGGNNEELRQDLYKMIKDPKNEEYKDQIYFVLAEMDFKEGNIKGAKENYSQSVFYSINNDRQKGISYLKLADIHFNEKDYIASQKYYDSCVAVLPKDYETYNQIKSKAEGLADLVFNYETVVLQDSLQKIALLPEKEREKFLKKTVKQIKEEEARKKREEEQRQLAMQKRLNNSLSNSGSGSKWYFYNQKAKSRGFNEFRALWGQRILEDDWRRSNKESFSEEEIEIDSVETQDEGLSVEDLRKDLPLTPQAMDSSTNLIMNALYNLGIIYKEQLNELPEASNYFQKVLDRGVEHEKVLPATYQLYLIYKKSGKNAKAEGYKQMILKKYPSSDIARLIKDPDYALNKEKEAKKELLEYEEVLKKYRRKRYMDVISKSTQIINNQPDNKYINKYYLLKAFALSKANFGGVSEIKKTLESLYQLAPSSEEGKQAKIYLDKMAKGEQITTPDKNSSSGYEFKPLEKHYFVLVFPDGGGNITQTKVKIANFNQTFFKSANLTMQNSVLDQNNQTLIVSSFVNEDKAMNYYRAFISQPAKDKIGDTATKYDNFVISQSNYLLLLKNKNLEEYIKFFNQNY
ncbi:MAG TPA: tetratricopeptide repeat protein [Crocinitomix sp.]|nr:tetratricopeptide repeat protein [Crocinitomix sp.]